jgi:hypothetical protein
MSSYLLFKILRGIVGSLGDKIQNPKSEFPQGPVARLVSPSMELNEEFKRVVGNIKLLEQQLISLNEKIVSNEQGSEIAEREIEEHFARCMDALAARKDVLLRELGEKRENQSMCPPLRKAFLSQPNFVLFLKFFLLSNSIYML